MKNRVKLFIALLIAASTSFSQEVVTLEQAQAFAIAHNYEIQNAQVDELIMKKKVWEITAQGLPQVSASGQFQYFLDIPTTLVPAQTFNPSAPAGTFIGLKFGTDYNLNGTVQVSQLVFSGNYLVGLQAAKASTNLYGMLTDKKEIDVKADVAETFYTVLVLKENKKILDSTLATVQEMLDLTKKLVAEEVMVRSNAVQLELSVLQMQNAITQVESQIILAGNLLKFQMGMEITKDIEVVGELVNVSDEVSTSFEPSQNIDYQILSVQKELNLLNVKNKQANYLPSVSTFLTHQQVAQRNETDFFNGDKPWFPTTIWGVQLSIPIFSSGMRMSQVSQAKLELEKSENSLAQLDEALKLQISQALTNYKLAKASVELKLKAIDAARLVFNDNRILYNEGALSSLELTQSQNQLLMQQTEYTNAYFELIKAKIALEKLMNKL